MDSVHKMHDPEGFELLEHYIFTFLDSTFECVAESFESQVQHVGLDKKHARTHQLLKSRVPS
jgi:hypothetical protein